jgi:hypothetical protein
MTFQIALQQLQIYVNGLVIQWNRLGEGYSRSADILRNNTLLDDAQRAKLARNQERIELDLHFYLNCWDKIAKYFTALVKYADSEDIKRSWTGIKPWLKKLKGVDIFSNIIMKELNWKTMEKFILHF